MIKSAADSRKDGADGFCFFASNCILSTLWFLKEKFFCINFAQKKKKKPPEDGLNQRVESVGDLSALINLRGVGSGFYLMLLGAAERGNQTAADA